MCGYENKNETKSKSMSKRVNKWRSVAAYIKIPTSTYAYHMYATTKNKV